MDSRIYLDNSATTRVDDDILAEITSFIQDNYGNPSSIYKEARTVKNKIDISRKSIANLIGAKEDEIYFTSGGTESNNWAIKGIVSKNKSKGRHIITSKIEHHAVLNVCEYLEDDGYEITYLDVDEYGFVKKEELEKHIRKDTVLVSIMLANNEIGTIQPIKELCEIAHKYGAYFHTDCVQALGKMKIDVKDLDIDLMSISAHKIHALKGVGALYIKSKVSIDSIIHGGSQESGKRSGTENVLGIISLGLACDKLINNEIDNQKIKTLRDYFIDNVLDKIDGVVLAGDRENRLINNINFCFENIDNKLLIVLLDKANIAASTGSACMSGSLEISHVLKAINMDENYINGSLRFSLSKYTTKEEIDYTIQKLQEILKKLRV